MNKLKGFALAGAMALGMATSAQAVTFTDNVNNNFTFTFEWVPASPLVVESEETDAFGIGFDFDLTISSVTGDNSLVGYFVDDATSRLTNDSTCSDFGSVGNCDLIFNSEPDGKLIFSGLSAGEYNFGIFGGPLSTAGSLTFEVAKIAAVPLPAGGPLLLGALGALGLKRRRKAA